MYGGTGAMDPSMPQGAGYPMDPSMAQGGGYPMDPSMAQGGGYPMDPSMAQGGGYPMDPSMQQGGFMMQTTMEPMGYTMGQAGMTQPMMQQNDPAAAAEARARAVEEVRLRKQKEDSYKVRRMEGRPKHGYSSVAAIGLSGFAGVLQLGALVMPSWRTSWLGVFGYPASRGWGLFSVQGRQKKMWHEIATTTCSIYGQLNVGGMCVTPGCMWYKLKCAVYIQFFIVSYGVGVVLLISLILHLLGVSWLARLTPRTIKYAAMWWPFCIALNLGLPIVWYIVTETLFENLDEQSYYPSPNVGPSMMASAVAQALLVIVAWCNCNLMRWWPEPDVKAFKDSDDEDDEDDEDEDDASEGGAEGKPKKKAAGQGSAPQAGMHPQEGGGVDYQQPPGYGMPSQEDYSYTYQQQPGGYDLQQQQGLQGYGDGVMQPEAAWGGSGAPPPGGAFAAGQPPLPPQQQ